MLVVTHFTIQPFVAGGTPVIRLAKTGLAVLLQHDEQVGEEGRHGSSTTTAAAAATTAVIDIVFGATTPLLRHQVGQAYIKAQ